jgi:NADPH-dependent 2,4-dienoyl-CoA reductase/sulfur reductase-like enzyme
MGRAHIADPQFVRKARTGELDRIRYCVGGLEGCRETKMNPGMALSWTVNPDVGREGEPLDPVSEPKSVAVVGGGPAGLEAARIAARRGHEVVLYEATSALGGQVRWAGRAPAKREYTSLVEFFRTELAAFDVDVRLDTNVDAALLERTNPDEVVVATGAGFHVPNIDGISAAVQRGVVETVETLFGDAESVSGPVVILGGNDHGCDLAELLAESGTRSTIVSEARILEERFQRTGPVDRSYADEMLERLQRNARIGLSGGSKVTAVSENVVKIRTEMGSERIPYGTIALSQRSAERSLAQRLGDEWSVTVVGDADQPTGLYPAIHEGAAAARTL